MPSMACIEKSLCNSPFIGYNPVDIVINKDLLDYENGKPCYWEVNNMHNGLFITDGTILEVVLRNVSEGIQGVRIVANDKEKAILTANKSMATIDKIKDAKIYVEVIPAKNASAYTAASV